MKQKTKMRTTILISAENKKKADKLRLIGVSQTKIFEAGINAYMDKVTSKDFKDFFKKIGIKEVF